LVAVIFFAGWHLYIGLMFEFNRELDFVDALYFTVRRAARLRRARLAIGCARVALPSDGAAASRLAHAQQIREQRPTAPRILAVAKLVHAP